MLPVALNEHCIACNGRPITEGDNRSNGLSSSTDCHFDERSEEKSYHVASFKFKVSSVKLTKTLLTEVKTTGFLAALEMTEGVK